MTPLSPNPEHPPKARKPRPWVLTVTLRARIPRKYIDGDLVLKDRYPTKKSAVQALGVILRGAGMWRKEFYEIVDYEIIDKRV